MTAAAVEKLARPVRLARPKLAVDAVLFALDDGRLKSYLVQLKQGPVAGKWAFPGGLVRRGELLDDAARRELEGASGLRDNTHPLDSSGSSSESLGGRLAESSFERTSQTGLLAAPSAPLAPHGLTGSAYLEQLFTFGDPSRDPFAHVVSDAYMALTDDPARVRTCSGKYASGQWYEVTALPPLAYDHALVADYAFNRLRAKLTYTNIAVHLLPPSFTFAELEELYTSIFERPLDRRNFRRRIMASGLLHPLGRTRRGAHRPANLYSFTQRSVQIIEML
jgi:8-oxo-dGTP diphosphatase